MSHYDVCYSGKDTEEDRERARADAREWFDSHSKHGFEGVKTIFTTSEPDITFDRFCFLMGFGGVQGYPVGVLYRDWYEKEPEWKTEEA